MAAAIMMPQNMGMVNPNHTTPPSKVLHCRAVCAGCREQDLIQVVSRFGNVTGIRLIPVKSQALVEFETLESAIACVTYSRIEPLLIRGRQMYVNYSKSQEISRKFNDPSNTQQPTQILLMTVINVIHPVTVDTIKKVCEQQKVQVQRIVFFHKNGLQMLVEFSSVTDAVHIQKVLNGCDIYPGCCTLKIEFSNSEKLNVRKNTVESYDIDFVENKFAPLITPPLLDAPSPLNAHPPQNYKNNNTAPERRFGLFDKLDFPNANSYESSYQVGAGGGYGGGGGGGGGWNNYMGPPQPVQPNYLDQQYASSFTDSAASSGGEGCVAMVFGINNDVMNCNHLFNLFCLYGNVVRVKILVNKPHIAMVQYANKMSTEIAIKNLNDLNLFGQTIQVAFSKHPHISDSGHDLRLADNSPAVANYETSRLNRYKPVPGGRSDLFSMIHPPSVVLHYFNAPAECTDERLQNLFASYSAEVPLKHVTMRKANSRVTSGLLEFSSISKAVEALVLVNHVTLYKEENIEGTDGSGKAPFTFKLAFSTSHSINDSV